MNKSNALFIMILAVGIAYAGQRITSQDLSADLTITNSLTVNGVQELGLRTNSQIQALSCAGGQGACRVTSSDEGDIYTSTGTAAGQWRNSRTGKGP